MTPSPRKSTILTVTLSPCLERSQFHVDPRLRAVNRARSQATFAGGKGGNAARMARTLGAEAVALLPLGGETGDLIARALEQDDDVRVAGVPTRDLNRLQFNLLEEAGPAWTSYLEDGVPLREEERDALLARFEELLPEADFVILSGSSPGASTDATYGLMVALARARPVPVLLDTYGRSLALALPLAPDVLKINVVESEGLLGRTIGTDAERWEALALLRQGGVEVAILTLGEEGALAAEGDRRWRVGPPRVTELSPVGCGDALAGALAVALARGEPLEEALRLGAAAGAASAATWFPASASRAEIEALRPQVVVSRAE